MWHGPTTEVCGLSFLFQFVASALIILLFSRATLFIRSVIRSHIRNFKFCSNHIKRNKKKVNLIEIMYFTSPNISEVLDFHHIFNIKIIDSIFKFLLLYHILEIWGAFYTYNASQWIPINKVIQQVMLCSLCYAGLTTSVAIISVLFLMAT